MSRHDEYQVRTVAGHRRAARLVKKGWEVISTSSNFLAPATVTLRRRNPRYRGE